jgi:uncharacterized protein YjbI with pentapeptide repeats
MQIDSQVFGRKLPKGTGWEENCFRYCTFVDLDEEGGGTDSAFIACEFASCEWYWGLFNLAVFVGVTFTGCTFRGTSFSGCKFVECVFVGCKFTRDNLDGHCSFDDTRWYACSQKDTQGLPQDVGHAL